MDRIRYVARARDLSTSLHTVVTDDLAELRTALAESTVSPPGLENHAAAPNVARMYSFWTGGKDHLEPDRRTAGAVVQDFPEVAAIAKANRQSIRPPVITRSALPWPTWTTIRWCWRTPAPCTPPPGSA